MPPARPKRFPPLVVMLATAVRERGRLVALKRCLTSLSGQTLPVRAYVAWHAVPDLHAETVEALHTFARSCSVPPCLIEAPAPRSQFEHLDAARRAALADAKAVKRAASSTWAIFSDDDDISAPQRAQMYAETCAMPQVPPSVVGVTCLRVAMRSERRRSSTARQRAIRSAADVDALLASGEAGIRSDLVEFWSYAVRLDALSRFIEAQSPALLRHHLADLRFRSWLGECGAMPSVERWHHSGGRLQWAYFYDTQYDGDEDGGGGGPTAGSGRVSMHLVRDTKGERERDPELARKYGGLDLPLLAQMRQVGEMATVRGFDDPSAGLGVQVPRKARRAKLVGLLLESLQRPVDLWSTLPPGRQEAYRACAQEMGDDFVRLGDELSGG
jgi:hypothetical protein